MANGIKFNWDQVSNRGGTTGGTGVKRQNIWGGYVSGEIGAGVGAEGYAEKGRHEKESKKYEKEEALKRGAIKDSFTSFMKGRKAVELEHRTDLKDLDTFGIKTPSYGGEEGMSLFGKKSRKEIKTMRRIFGGRKKSDFVTINQSVIDKMKSDPDYAIKILSDKATMSKISEYTKAGYLEEGELQKLFTGKDDITSEGYSLATHITDYANMDSAALEDLYESAEIGGVNIKSLIDRGSQIDANRDVDRGMDKLERQQISKDVESGVEAIDADFDIQRDKELSAEMEGDWAKKREAEGEEYRRLETGRWQVEDVAGNIASKGVDYRAKDLQREELYKKELEKFDAFKASYEEESGALQAESADWFEGAKAWPGAKKTSLSQEEWDAVMSEQQFDYFDSSSAGVDAAIGAATNAAVFGEDLDYYP